MPRMRTDVELREAMQVYRAETGMTQSGAALAAGISQKQWHYIESGTTEHPRIKTRARIEALLPPMPDEPGVVETIDAYQRRKPVTGQPHRHDLSTGLIKCTVTTTTTLPAQAYAVLAELVIALEAANTKLVELIGSDLDQ